MKFVFTCGGTAGHINPALAVATKLRELLPSCEILFIGAEDRMEMELVPLEGYDIKGIKITDISREKSVDGLVHNIKTAFNVLTSTAKVKDILREFRPNAVIGTGGYVCYPVISAAHSLNIPTLVHESNAAPGLTTKMLSHFVDRILVGIDGCQNEYPNPEKVIVTGTPVRGSFAKYTKESAKAELGLSPSEKLVVSLWGSLGAGFMNDVICDMIPALNCSPDFKMIHATGEHYYKDFMTRLEESCPDYADKGVEIREYIHDTPRVMCAADLVMCRAGASTLSELSYIGKPAILVPSPNVTENHQEKNARMNEKGGGSVVLLEKDITPESLRNTIASIISNDELLAQMSQNMSSTAVADSTETIAKIILDLCKELPV